MEKFIYSNISIDKCLEQASKDLNIPVEEIEYKVVEEELMTQDKVTISISSKDIENSEKVDGRVYVIDGQIIVKNAKNGGKPAMISIGRNVQVMIDDKEISTISEVYENSKIDVIFKEQKAVRNLNISVSRDCMSAHIDIFYEPEISYKLKDTEERNFITLEEVEKDRIYPPNFSVSEIEKELIAAGIMFGIDREKIKQCSEADEVRDLVIAEGKPVVDSEDDTLEVKFEQNSKKHSVDLKGNIDYKDIGSIKSVKKGQTLAIIHKGKLGTNGVSVKGKIIQAKKGKLLRIKCGAGCELHGNTVKSIIEGKPMYKGGLFTVTSIHEVKSNVDLTTGNIKFDGDVIVYGNVLEGMKVEGLNGVEIYKSVASAEIKSNHDIKIGGNVLLSDVVAGGKNNVNIKLEKDMGKLLSDLEELRKSTEKVLKNKLLGRKARDGEIIKILIENKFHDIPKILKEMDKIYAEHPNLDRNFTLVLKSNLLGFGPLNIENYLKLLDIEKLIAKQRQFIALDSIKPADIEIAYCQDSVLRATGNIYITGKGEYISNIFSNDSIFFKGFNSVARGGIIKAKNEIHCNQVGSDAGVPTKLIVDAGGEIWAKFAYNNTRFVVGDLEYILEQPSKDIHVYLDRHGELQVDKFNMI